MGHRTYRRIESVGEMTENYKDSYFYERIRERWGGEAMAGLRVMIKMWGLTMWPVNIIAMISVTLFDKLAGRVPSPSDLGGKIDL